jgi:hypothetical protein
MGISAVVEDRVVEVEKHRAGERHPLRVAEILARRRG